MSKVKVISLPPEFVCLLKHSQHPCHICCTALAEQTRVRSRCHGSSGEGGSEIERQSKRTRLATLQAPQVISCAID
jgi:hypothetical protein